MVKRAHGLSLTNEIQAWPEAKDKISYPLPQRERKGRRTRCTFLSPKGRGSNFNI
ncbi:hypothetical protein EV132_102488 [Rhizobium sullae]|uniref:Uncharacterized protein n=1 Tax=Rhizobium sullae TaxID=50338 RepID=A0A4R3QEQ9_RHISU|nr:hypothetical protein EV132_102488 [Rhizobium sullae]